MVRPYELMAFLVLSCSVASAAEGDSCDASLKPDPRSKYGYMRRDDRCEGTFIRTVSGGGLAPQSLTTDLEDYAEGEGALFILWPHLDKSPLHIRASWLRRRSYYQMDTQQPGTASSYKWSADVVRSLAVPPTELGLLAYVTQPLGEEDEQQVLVPVRLALQKSPAPPADRYKIKLFPGVTLSELFITIASVDSSGSVGEVVRNKHLLKSEPMPANSPLILDIPISWFPKPGIYWVRLSAMSNQKSPLVSEFFLLHVPSN